ncbi:PDZ domain-containing protein [Aureibaculum sp. 2210JD6-5]|uniref:M61 family metallopeptidase n=1 Tax=Aureibaculum sp. 2210JD6-5 TaxID=3103957 RepID=UPI002AAF023C|nr:PDZ domain-containing protein [Aureibaculum sp. 2210JD6-5]MDY7395167.1 PDZ domain-containing protein [Aureibaculum sp. 2210JD6-5]
MKNKLLLILLAIFLSLTGFTQTTNNYSISFENAVHHEAEVTAVFSNLENKVLQLRMSRTSPGRYAVHEFAKNVYNVKAVDGKGNELNVTRNDPHQWNIGSHDGTVKVTYTLFGNRGDGTYSQIDETHAHLNIPATFMYALDYEHRPINVTFNVRKDLNWKVATQLKSLGNNTFYALNLDYFMDSPTEVSNHSVRNFEVANNDGKKQKINFVLHHNGTEAELDEYFEKVKKIVLAQKEVYGELPDFDFGEYTFLACYIPNASGDGMEHRNSTILTSTRSLANGGMEGNIGTVSHEFFHAWNVERIRPQSLEPFDYTEANMSGELWFAEGFTSYYTNLILCRAGLISPQQYVEGLSGGLNYVWNSPARKYFNPIEMSYQAPFVDAARSVDPVNRENTFISYYTYGSVLGLALDLSLRNLNGDKNLDDFMKLVWKTYGKAEIPYTVRDLQNLLSDYAGKEFALNFFSKYIFDSQMPDYKTLFASVGVNFDQSKQNELDLGVRLSNFKVRSNPSEGRAAFKAGLADGDEIISVDDKPITSETKQSAYFGQFAPNQTVKVIFKRFGEQKETMFTFDTNNDYSTRLLENPDKKVKENRKSWLGVE